jgi:16S rRNA (guanine(966)-N(2))-methyltransferase RsmD
MRIIAGKYRSRILKSLKGLELRPSSDYLRETLFNVLGPNVEGSRFLDLYAGTGAVGIEAISRGAEEAVFVEHHAPTVKLIRENLASLKIESGVEVISANAAAALQKLAKWPQQPFDFVFLDPPYAFEQEYETTLSMLGNSKLISPDSIVIAEHRKTLDLAESYGVLRQYRVLKQGDAALSFFCMEEAAA